MVITNTIISYPSHVGSERFSQELAPIRVRVSAARLSAQLQACSLYMVSRNQGLVWKADILGDLGGLEFFKNLGIYGFGEQDHNDSGVSCDDRNNPNQSMQQHRQQKRRAILTELQAIEIFAFRNESSILRMVSSASVVAKRYGINERTVRDIWTQRTWTHATCSLAANAGPMAKRTMGRPVGSKDARPRKLKRVAGTTILHDPSTASTESKCNAMVRVYATGPRSESHKPTDQEQQARALQWRSFDFLLLTEASDEAVLLGDLSISEHEREEQASIDDQLHAWAHRGPQWIISAALPLHGDSPWDCAPSVC
jgi:hypothetical protein